MRQEPKVASSILQPPDLRARYDSGGQPVAYNPDLLALLERFFSSADHDRERLRLGLTDMQNDFRGKKPFGEPQSTFLANTVR